VKLSAAQPVDPAQEKDMAEHVEAEQEHIEITPTEARQGFKGADVLAVLAVSTFLAAVGLTTFFLTTSLAG
jgi:hypothetical protein